MTQKIISNLNGALIPKSGLDIHNEGNWDSIDILYNYGTPRSAIFYSRLFLPQFTVIDGYVMLNDGFGQLPDKFNLEGTTWERSVREAVDSYNWRDFSMIFKAEDVSEDEYYMLAELMARAWRGQLLLQFPNRRFVVKVFSPDVTGDAVGVGFEEVIDP